MRSSTGPTTRAVILARGVGTRMRRADPRARLSNSQASAADAGLKGMISIGRPFLEYLISACADAGITDVCLVVGPEHQRVRDHFGGEVALTRVRVHFAVQEQPRGTADAVAAAESFSQGEHVLVLNSDNYYPPHVLRALQELGGPGVAAFDRAALARLGNIDAARIAQFAILTVDANGVLERIVEKPDEALIRSLGAQVLVGMNCWSLPPDIYLACRRIAPSERGELELPDAVMFASRRLGVPFRVLAFHEGVLDLSSRSDIIPVAAHLRGVEPRL